MNKAKQNHVENNDIEKLSSMASDYLIRQAMTGADILQSFIPSSVS